MYLELKQNVEKCYYAITIRGKSTSVCPNQTQLFIQQLLQELKEESLNRRSICGRERRERREHAGGERDRKKKNLTSPRFVFNSLGKLISALVLIKGFSRL